MKNSVKTLTGKIIDVASLGGNSEDSKDRQGEDYSRPETKSATLKRKRKVTLILFHKTNMAQTQFWYIKNLHKQWTKVGQFRKTIDLYEVGISNRCMRVQLIIYTTHYK